ncbi:MAG: hypothetical protein AVDCRST_MAG73-313, partial [uncultured Thermomicrobiales bacterium]
WPAAASRPARSDAPDGRPDHRTGPPTGRARAMLPYDSTSSRLRRPRWAMAVARAPDATIGTRQRSS